MDSSLSRCRWWRSLKSLFKSLIYMSEAMRSQNSPGMSHDTPVPRRRFSGFSPALPGEEPIVSGGPRNDNNRWGVDDGPAEKQPKLANFPETPVLPSDPLDKAIGFGEKPRSAPDGFVDFTVPSMPGQTVFGQGDSSESRIEDTQEDFPTIDPEDIEEVKE